MLAPGGKSYDKPRKHIKKQRHHIADKDLYSQSYGFSSGHVWTWKLDHRAGWAPKNRCFWTVVLQKTLESPLDSKEIKPVNSKGTQPWLFIGRTDVEAETPILWPPDVKSQLIGKDPMLGKTECGTLCGIDIVLVGAQRLSCVQLFVTPWTVALQASLSITISQSLLKFMSIESVCHPTLSFSVPLSSCLQSFPASGSFLMSWFYVSGSQCIAASASASVFPMNIEDQFPLGLTHLISLHFKGLSRVFCNTTVQKHQFFGAQLSL